MNLNKILIVGLGGFLGTVLRYAVTVSCTKKFGNSFPYGTLIVNVAGGLIMGFIMQAGTSAFNLSPNAKIFLTTGIMGGLTTFSTFSFETVSFFSEGNVIMGSLNAGLNLFLALFAVSVGKWIAMLI